MTDEQLKNLKQATEAEHRQILLLSNKYIKEDMAVMGFLAGVLFSTIVVIVVVLVVKLIA